MKKFDWLDNFAQEQYKKERLKKQASTEKKAENIIVNPEDVPGAQNGAEVQFNGESFKVVDANFSDEVGPGVVLEKAAGASDGSYNGLEQDPMGLAMGTQPGAVSTPSTGGQTYHRTKLDIQQTYDNDQDAQYGQSSAPATAQEIAGEDAVDRTTVPGHYTPSPGLSTAPAVGAPVPGAAPVATVDPAFSAGVDAPVAPVTDAPVVEAPAAEVPGEESAEVEVTEEEVPAEGEEENKEEENKVLASLKKALPKKATTVASLNARIISLANEVSDAITATVEDVLEDAEEAVKSYVPARLASVALTKLEEALEEEGVEALFEKTISKEALAKTAGEEISDEEINEVVQKVAEIVVAELEDVLKDADEEMDSERKSLADDETGFETEAKLKAMVERKLQAKGIYTRFARTASAPVKKTIAQKIRDARKSR